MLLYVFTQYSSRDNFDFQKMQQPPPTSNSGLKEKNLKCFIYGPS